jgi:hypothetical protein
MRKIQLFSKFSVTIMALALLVFALSPSPTAAATSVFINEIHYDNAGTDAGEAIEFVGPAGTDLTGWSLVLYNGSGGAVYDTDALTGAIPDLGGGFGVVVVNYPVNGIQNGSPDGVALVNASNNVVQFLSYEGSFTAAGGPADGMTSVDIGVAEGSTTSVGDSLQLIGSGATDADFTWASVQPNTFGAFNSGQSFVGVAVLVINEVDYDQPSTDTAEFVEIKNIGTASADLSAYTLELVNGTGGGASIYQSYTLSAVTLPAGDYFVICGDAANVVNCDLDVSPDSNLIQNGAPDAVGLRFNGALVDAVSYEGDTGAPYTEGSGAGLEDSGDGSISRCDDGSDTNQNNVDLVFGATSTPGAENVCAPPPPPESCGDTFTPIYTIQGSGSASPLDGSEVSTEGVVVGDFQAGKSGFFLQDAPGDGDTATSDGIFVFSTSLDVNEGDHVRVRGTVDEFFGLTEITSVSQIWSCSTGNNVAATTLTLPVTSLDDFEPYEGMLVTLPKTLYISEYFNFDRFGEIVLTTERQFQPTAVFEPGSSEAAALALANSLGRITLDDGRGSSNPDPAIHPNGGIFDLNNLFRGGDTVQNVTGALDFDFGLYKIQPTQGADYSNDNLRTDEPDDVGGNLKVASFNVLNYFTTLDDGVNDICGPLQNQECRGADNATEFTRQRDKIIAALAAMDADVVGLIEIENHPGDVPTADLVSGLNAVMGAGTYEYIATGAIGSDAIRQALIYKAAKVAPLGAYAILDATVDSRFLDDFNRPVLAQSFQDNATGGIFTVAVNHLKSKGSPCDAVGDPDTGDGAGNCNLTRKAAAEALVDWLASDPTGSGDADFLIIGDLNSYDKEDPIDVLLAGGYTDLVKEYGGEFAYSYVFDGQLGYLDHALAGPDMLGEVTGTTVWHINADEPDLIDYDTSFKGPNQDAIYAPDAYRSSDHDPVIVGLDTCDEIAPTLEVSVSPDSLWPANHKYVTVKATVVANDDFDPNPTITLVSVTSNEPDNGLGDGDTPNDIVIVDEYTFKLRAERSGTGEGRIYTITYEVTDACGNVTTMSVAVSVPHNR